MDLEKGIWNGQIVDPPLLDTLFARREEATLQLFVDRLPTDDLRTEARRRIVRLHIAASAFPEVREHAEDIEERVITRGANAIATDRSRRHAAGWTRRRCRCAA